MTLPALGESVTEGTVTRWLKQVGDDVAVDEPLLEVSTDKVDTEIPSPVAGTLLEIKVEEDETVEVGAELALIGAKGAAPSGGRRRAAGRGAGSRSRAGARAGAEPEPEPEPERAEPEPEEKAEPEPEQKPEPEPGRPAARRRGTGRTRGAGGSRRATGYVTPLVRKLAAQHDVDLATVTGTGVGGRIRKQDVLDAAAKKGTKEAATAAAKAAAPAAAAAPRPPRPRRPPPHRPPPRRARRAARQDREDDAPAQGDRQADGRVAADQRPADHGGRGRRHRDRAAARQR